MNRSMIIFNRKKKKLKKENNLPTLSVNKIIQNLNFHSEMFIMKEIVKSCMIFANSFI